LLIAIICITVSFVSTCYLSLVTQNIRRQLSKKKYLQIFFFIDKKMIFAASFISLKTAKLPTHKFAAVFFFSLHKIFLQKEEKFGC